MGNSTFRTQNDTDSANFQYAVNKKIVLKTSSQVGLKSGKGGGGVLFLGLEFFKDSKFRPLHAQKINIRHDL